MASPCVGRCQLEGDSCLGCGRTLAEIASWSTLTQAQQLAIMATLATRPTGQGVMRVVPQTQGTGAQAGGSTETGLPASTHLCPGCGETAYCALSAGQGIGDCWCSQLPAIAMSEAPACWCRACLVRAIEARDAR
ncbi:DUF1289 domain-containing protein [Aeromonas bivalvium]|uniref:DUF1289 domain-containing protein n=1 Tax=Aeromonas bivalvium TaxID=440079 RepID=UPI000DD0CFFB|nr:DUF1289 domain-containing protein [Aeromonas bivalvium]